MLKNEYHESCLTPFPVSPKGEKLPWLLLPPWGKVGKGVKSQRAIILLFIITDPHDVLALKQ
jgi:hypothetical protein